MVRVGMRATFALWHGESSEPVLPGHPEVDPERVVGNDRLAVTCHRGIAALLKRRDRGFRQFAHRLKSSAIADTSRERDHALDDQAPLHVLHQRRASVVGVRAGDLTWRGAVGGYRFGSVAWGSSPLLNQRVLAACDLNLLGSAVGYFSVEAHRIDPIGQRLEYDHTAAIRSTNGRSNASCIFDVHVGIGSQSDNYDRPRRFLHLVESCTRTAALMAIRKSHQRFSQPEQSGSPPRGTSENTVHLANLLRPLRQHR